LCKALAKPAGQGGIGSVAGTGGKATPSVGGDGEVLENQQYQLKTPGSAQMSPNQYK
jgi:hypothetical protein